MSTVTNKEFAATIRPAVNGQSDKFSWRLYKRALERGREHVYLASWCPIYGDTVPDLDCMKAGDVAQLRLLMIGREIEAEDGYFTGKNLMNVMRVGASLQDMAYGRNFGTESWIDVTDWFWREYLARGRCIIQGHWVHEWVRINASARRCKYCGRHEHRTVRSVRKIERVETWSADARVAA